MASKTTAQANPNVAVVKTLEETFKKQTAVFTRILMQV